MTLWERFRAHLMREENVMWQTAYIDKNGHLVHHQTGNAVNGIYGTSDNPEKSVLLWHVDMSVNS